MPPPGTRSYAAIDGDWLIVGTPEATGSTVASGAAYLFSRNGVLWEREEKIYPANGQAGDDFGVFADISQQSAALVCLASDPNGVTRWAIRIYVRNGGSWDHEALLFPSDGEPSDGLWSVDLEVDVLVAGAPFDDDHGSWSGSAYVFRRAGTVWSEEAKLVPSDGHESAQFGFSVTLSEADGRIVIGARFDRKILHNQVRGPRFSVQSL